MTDEPVVVTGAGSGIGRAVALLCAERGARVAALDIDADSATRIAEEALELGAGAVLGVECDVSSEVSVAAAIDRCVADLGVPFGVFANAGIEINAPIHEMALADWQRVLDVNLTGTFLTCKHAVRVMLAAGHGGSIVCTSSPSAVVGFAGGDNAAYGASKGGISAFVRAVALDYGGHGIRVNAVVPGATDTPLLLAGVAEESRELARNEVERQAREQVPLGRLGQPREVAYAVAWLLSDEAAYVTGTQLVCDGGLLAKGANTF